MADHPATVPELYENQLGQCLTARTKSLAKYAATLGPPDMCHICKIQEKPQSLLRSTPLPPTLVGTYHHVYGVDCSSPAAIAAYFNTLVFAISKPGGSSKATWKLQSGTYCCYNAFTRVDVRVEVTLPGTVNAYVLDAQGRRYGCDDRMWQEVLISATLRALSHISPFAVQLEGLRTLYPFKRPDDETLFLRAAADLFWDGRYLGTDELTAPVTDINNRLAVGVRDYFFSTYRYTKCMDFFLPLAAKSPGLTAILAEAQARFGQASAAACLLAEHVVHTPASYPMLLAQSRLLLDLGLAPEALAVAKRCVDSAPAVAGAWVHLARVYAATGDPGMALVALNVAPMAHGHDAVPVEMPEPARTQNVSEVIRDMIAEEDDGDQTLATLPANSLRGTFLDAYRVLTLMLKRMAWDELLQHRSNMFLMEEPAAPGDVQADAQAQAQAQEGAAGSKARGSRRLLERWLDQLFTALYQDLMCSVIWNAQEQHAAKTGTRVEHTVGDLLRYGELALRLGRHEEALKAFQQCTSQGFCLRGLLAILDLYASDGAVEETLATVDAICQFFDINPDLPLAPETYEAVCKLIGRYGLALLNQKGGKWVTKSQHVKRFIDRAIAWKVQGYDR